MENQDTMESLPRDVVQKIVRFCGERDHQELAKTSNDLFGAVVMSKKRKLTNDTSLQWCAGEIVWASLGSYCFWPALILDAPKENGNIYSVNLTTFD